MVLRWLEGFESCEDSDYILSRYRTAAPATIAGGTTYARGTGKGLRIGSVESYFKTKALVGAVQNEWVVGFAFYMESNTGAGLGSIHDQVFSVQFITDTDTTPVVQCALILARVHDQAYKWQLRHGPDDDDILIDESTPFWANKWHFFEFKITVHTTNGAWELKQDGVVTMDSDTITDDTAADGSNGCDSIGFTAWENFAGTPQAYFDDIYIIDTTGTVNNDYLGDLEIEGWLPTSDGDLTQWTPSTGSTHYNLVNEALHSVGNDDDKVYNDTVDNIDLYGFDNLSRAKTILGLAVTIRAAMQTAGSRSVKIALRNSADTDNVGSSTFSLSDTAWEMFVEMFDQDPAAGPGSWTESALNDYQFGVKMTA